MMEYRTGDILFIEIPNAIEHQQGGNRFAVVVTNNIGNYHSQTIGVITSTTKRDDHQPTHAFFKAGEIPCLPKDTSFCAENYWTINKSQIIRKVGHMTDSQLEKVAEAMLYSIPFIIKLLNSDVMENKRLQHIYKA